MKRALILALALALPAGAQTVTTQDYTFTVAQMSACNTSPITLVAATPGTAYLPVRALAKRTGDPYATQAGEVWIRYVTSAPFVHMRLDTQAGGLLTNRNAWLAFAPGAGRYGIEDALGGDIGGKALQLICSVGDPTTSLAAPGSDVTLRLVYEEWSTVP